MGVESTSGYSFGVGWYGEDPELTLYRSILPSWNDGNLRELATLRGATRYDLPNDVPEEGYKPFRTR